MKNHICIDLLFIVLKDIRILIESLGYTELKEYDLKILKSSRYLYLVKSNKNNKYINSDYTFSISLQYNSSDIYYISKEDIQEYLELLKLFNMSLTNFLSNQG